MVASAVILVGAGYISWRHFRATAPAKVGKIRLAVLPFENLTGDPNKEYLADGLTEETISQLGRLNPEQLGVIARTSVMGDEVVASTREQNSVTGMRCTAIDNPMCAGTGHRICNDCMKACIYQKQDPVDIPQVETRTLKDVLALPWGFEIYSC